jgi:hypothetical protein
VLLLDKNKCLNLTDEELWCLCVENIEKSADNLFRYASILSDYDNSWEVTHWLGHAAEEAIESISAIGKRGYNGNK